MKWSCSTSFPWLIMLRTTSATMLAVLIMIYRGINYILLLINNNCQMFILQGESHFIFLNQLRAYIRCKYNNINFLLLYIKPMMQQVQMNDEQVLRAMTEGHSSAEFLMLLKGFVVGYLGIPLNHGKITEIMSMMDIYYDWIEMGTISRQNAISLFIHPLKKIQSFHNKNSNSQDVSQGITEFQRQVEGLVGRIIEDENYFSNASRAYNPKQDILMSLNFTQNQCTICSVIMEPQQVLILDCTHVYHFQCLHQHVKNSIESGQVVIKCPSEYCGIELGHNQLLNFMTPELQRKHQGFMMNQYVEKSGGSTSWCPTPDCNSLFEFDPSVTDFSCRNCRKRYCLRCRCEFHSNMTCTEYRDYMGMNPEDQSFVNFARGARFKQCPRCKFWVEKSVGCVSMKCRCSQEFCYECGGVTCPHGTCSKNSIGNQNRLLNRRT